MAPPDFVAEVVAEVVAGVLADLRQAGIERGGFVALASRPGVGLGLATADGYVSGIVIDDPSAVVAAIDAEIRPRWVVWSGDTTGTLIGAGVRIATCWDLAAVHRLLFGGWRAEPARIVALLAGLSISTIPSMGQLSLLDAAGDDGSDFTDPVRPDGHLRPEWAAGGWHADVEHLAAWAAAALAASEGQLERLATSEAAPRHTATARSESTAELLCTELAADGLPIDVTAIEELIASFVGPRTTTERAAAERRAERDAEVLRHVPASSDIDLRNPAHVRSLLRRIGVDVPDTRAWRLEPFRAEHPAVDALLTWRKAERVATTYGYAWLDEHVGADGRLRGAWSGSDGAAGRMTAQAGLHNMPADMRSAVDAGEGWVFVRADLGQIEPRVLAAISGDRLLAAATADDDMYAPVAQRLGVERAIAKVAVLAAMYGQTSGAAGQALRGMEAAYPVAIAHLNAADEAGRAGRDLRTYGGRLIRMWPTPDHLDDRDQRAVANGRGRYARNALVQGAAAELFKSWAVTVRARGAEHDARVVLCLHDELLVHAPVRSAGTVAALVDDCLQEAAWRWAPDRSVRFVSDTSIVRRWSEAKGAEPTDADLDSGDESGNGVDGSGRE
ncbi:MAG: putative polymerase [Acidimicrobiales bacterium]|nr:putative polymerase [Acidimicrobiales bacterium]